MERVRSVQEQSAGARLNLAIGYIKIPFTARQRRIWNLYKAQS